MKVLKTALLALALPIFFQNSSKAQKLKSQTSSIPTRWTKQVKADNPLPEYPRPQLVRKAWKNLNGLWEYTISPKLAGRPTSYDGKILVPYPIESALSGVKRQLKPDDLLWYKRNFIRPQMRPGEKILLNFGAVDFQSTVYINGKEIGKHTGGYQSFSMDITESLKEGQNELVVKVWDPSDEGPNPHGKQVLNPQGIMYTSSSGIWQTVWLETVPADHVQSLRISPDVDKSLIKVVVKSESNAEVLLSAAGATVKGNTNTEITLPVKNARSWSPEDPYLYDLTVTLGRDKVNSYFGMRKIEVKKDEKGIDRIFLNGKYTYNLGTLDQGYWPDGLYTAPTDEALAFDIKASKAMGFNTIRKHIKVEPARWYYHADKLGMLVWQDMVNPGSDTPEGRTQFEKENKETIAQLYNHPSIVTWVLFNEKWGQYDQERLTKELKILDPTRLVNGHSGEMLYVNDALRSPSPNAWAGADMTDVHAYPNPGHIRFKKGKAAVLGEFGGIGVPIEGHLWDDLVAGWGYDGVVTPRRLRAQLAQMVDSLKKLEELGLSASIYTQPFDVESEQNGLITYDRQVLKLPVETYREIHSKLWPITSNYLEATKGFDALIADTISLSYEERVQTYRDGNRDQRFLRNLAIMADAKKDTSLSRSIAREYIKKLSSPLTTETLKFIRKFTFTTADPGFKIFLDNIEDVNRLLGKDEAEAKLTALIEAEIISPNIKKGAVPNWEKFNEHAVTIYGKLGEEAVLQHKVLYSINHQDWINFANAVKPWFEKYGQNRKWIGSVMLNDMAWATFQSTSDISALEAAVILSKGSIKLKEVGGAFDTYANLLYKLGRKDEALIWQAKAIAIDPNNVEIKATYDKMQKGLPTW